MYLPSSGSRRKLVLAIALGVVLCAAIVGVYFSVRRGVQRQTAPGPEEDKLTLMCNECSAVFDQLRKELPQEFLADGMAGKLAAIDCPKCGAEAAAYLPHRCPSCKKYYLTEKCRRRPDPPAAGPQPERCPHCDTVPYEWYLKNVKPRI